MTIALTIYFLVWPVIVASVLLVICRGFLRELRQAKREGLLGVRPTPKQRKRITVVRLLTRPPCKTCWRRKRGSAKARCDQRIQ